jgi:DNA-binding response OmpR family regulator
MATILVVDDERNIRTLFAEELEDMGYEVETAASATEAIEKFRAKAPDLMIVDIRMPDMSGLEMIQVIRQFDDDIPVIICSALHALRDDFTVWESRISAFLDKPVDLDDLRKAVRKALREAKKE